jgi:NAD-dependent deacetylase
LNSLHIEKSVYNSLKFLEKKINGVVWFGEMLPNDCWDHDVNICGRSDLLIIIGTSGSVYPAASLPYYAGDATIIQINPKCAQFASRIDYNLEGKAGEILPLLFKEVFSEQ